MVWQDSFFQTDHIDVGKLQSLCTMQRHQDDRISFQLFLFLVRCVLITQHQSVEEFSHAGMFTFLFIGTQRIDHLLNAGPAGLAIFGIVVQTVNFPSVVDRLDQTPRCIDERLVLHRGPRTFHRSDQAIDSTIRGVGQFGTITTGEHRPNIGFVFQRMLQDRICCFFTDSPRRAIDNSQYRKVVRFIQQA